MRFISTCAVLVLLAACGGSSDGPDLEGVWTGTYDPAPPNLTTLNAVIHSGGPAIFFDSNGLTYVMTAAPASNINTAMEVYPTYGYIFTDRQHTLPVSIKGTASDSNINGQFGLNGATANFNLHPVKTFAGTPSVVAGNWQGQVFGGYQLALDVTASGSITGRDVYGCDFTGQITQVSAGENLFDVRLVNSGFAVVCGNTMNGLAYESGTDEIGVFGHGAGTYYYLSVYDANIAITGEFKVQ